MWKQYESSIGEGCSGQHCCQSKLQIDCSQRRSHAESKHWKDNGSDGGEVYTKVYLEFRLGKFIFLGSSSEKSDAKSNTSVCDNFSKRIFIIVGCIVFDYSSFVAFAPETVYSNWVMAALCGVHDKHVHRETIWILIEMYGLSIRHFIWIKL